MRLLAGKACLAVARRAEAENQVVALGCLGAVAISVLFAQCNKSPTTPSPGTQPPVPGPSPTPPLPQAPGPAIFVGAGDIAIASGHDDATARLMDTIGGDVFTLGDDAYPNGSPENFRVFDRTWGRFVGRIHPAPGNHEYMTPGAAGYFGYFGEAAGPSGQGYYSFNLGAWHIISLNSNYEFGVGVDARLRAGRLAAGRNWRRTPTSARWRTGIIRCSRLARTATIPACGRFSTFFTTRTPTSC